jgi:cytochrome P450
LNDPADLQHVLLHNAGNYEKTPRITAGWGRRFAGDTLLTRTGAAHRVRRQIVQQALASVGITPLFEAAERAASVHTATWLPGQVIEVRPAMLTIAKRVISELLFGSDFFDPDGAWAWAIGERCRYFEQRLTSPLPLGRLAPAPPRLRHAQGIVDAVLAEQIAREREVRHQPGTVLGTLLAARYADGMAMSDQELKDEMVALAMAGYETIAEALTWTWYLLARHQDAQAMLRDELRSLQVPKLTTHAIAQLPYARAVVSEVIRLYPPTWLFVRVVQEPDTLPSGYTLPAQGQVYCSQWVTHRDARYFAEPEAFRPERFAEAETPSWPRLTYFPFGAGPRACVGAAIATAEIVSVLAAVLPRWNVALRETAEVSAYPGIALRPSRPIQVFVRPTSYS